jgi:predicted nuclease of restriction endonuclease-like (RecB) superfamily
VRLLSVIDLKARRHYEEEALRGSWSVRQFDRQISALSFQRSRSEKVKSSTAGNSPDFEMKDPFVLSSWD